MKKFLIKISILVFLLFLVLSGTVFAKKILPKKDTSSTHLTNISISPKLRSDRLALIVNFSNLGVVKAVAYNLSYTSNGVAQGVVGSINPTTNTASRELLFGTCSSGVCKYHTNLANMRLVVTTTLKSGAKLSKSYRIKP